MNRIVLCAVAAMLLPGCNMLDVSNDKHEFVSTPHQPITIDVVASMTDGSVLWTMDVPPNQKLHLDFDRPNESELMEVNVDKAASKLRWALFAVEDGRRLDYGQQNLPGVPVRMSMRLRPAPEWPEGFVPPGEEEAGPQPLETLDGPAIEKAEEAEEGHDDDGGDDGEAHGEGDEDAAEHHDDEDNDAEK